PGDVEVDVRGMQHRGVGAAGDVVPVKADVEVPEGYVDVEQILELLVQPLSEKRASAMDSYERRNGLSRVALDDLVRDAGQRPPHVLLVEDHLLVGFHLFLPGLAGPG